MPIRIELPEGFVDPAGNPFIEVPDEASPEQINEFLASNPDFIRRRPYGILETVGKGVASGTVGIASDILKIPGFLVGKPELFKSTYTPLEELRRKTFGPPPGSDKNLYEIAREKGLATALKEGFFSKRTVYDVSRLVPQFITMIASGGLIGAGIKGAVGGAGLASKLGGLAGAGAVAGTLEGVSSAEETRGLGGTVDEQRTNLIVTTFISTILNSAGFGALTTRFMQGPIGRRFVEKVIAGGLEAATEWLEEPVQTGLLKMEGFDVDARKRLLAALDVIPASFITGTGVATLHDIITAVSPKESELDKMNKKGLIIDPDKLVKISPEQEEQIRNAVGIKHLPKNIQDMHILNYRNLFTTAGISKGLDPQEWFDKTWEAFVEAGLAKPGKYGILTQNTRQELYDKLRRLDATLSNLSTRPITKERTELIIKLDKLRKEIKAKLHEGLYQMGDPTLFPTLWSSIQKVPKGIMDKTTSGEPGIKYSKLDKLFSKGTGAFLLRAKIQFDKYKDKDAVVPMREIKEFVALQGIGFDEIDQGGARKLIAWFEKDSSIIGRLGISDKTISNKKYLALNKVKTLLPKEGIPLEPLLAKDALRRAMIEGYEGIVVDDPGLAKILEEETGIKRDSKTNAITFTPEARDEAIQRYDYVVRMSKHGPRAALIGLSDTGEQVDVREAAKYLFLAINNPDPTTGHHEFFHSIILSARGDFKKLIENAAFKAGYYKGSKVIPIEDWTLSQDSPHEKLARDYEKWIIRGEVPKALRNDQRYVNMFKTIQASFAEVYKANRFMMDKNIPASTLYLYDFLATVPAYGEAAGGAATIALDFANRLWATPSAAAPGEKKRSAKGTLTQPYMPDESEEAELFYREMENLVSGVMHKTDATPGYVTSTRRSAYEYNISNKYDVSYDFFEETFNGILHDKVSAYLRGDEAKKRIDEVMNLYSRMKKASIQYESTLDKLLSDRTVGHTPDNKKLFKAFRTYRDLTTAYNESVIDASKKLDINEEILRIFLDYAVDKKYGGKTPFGILNQPGNYKATNLFSDEGESSIYHTIAAHALLRLKENDPMSPMNDSTLYMQAQKLIDTGIGPKLVKKGLSGKAFSDVELLALGLHAELATKSMDMLFESNHPKAQEMWDAYTTEIMNAIRTASNATGRALRANQLLTIRDNATRMLRAAAGLKLTRQQIIELEKALASNNLEKIKQAISAVSEDASDGDPKRKPRITSVIKSLWYQSLLSGKANITNFTMNGLWLSYLTVHKAHTGMIDSIYSKITGHPRATYAGEGLALFKSALGAFAGILGGKSDVAKFTRHSFAAGLRGEVPSQYRDVSEEVAFTKLDEEVGHLPRVILDAFIEAGLNNKFWRFTAGALEFPSRLMNAVDLYYKAIAETATRDFIYKRLGDFIENKDAEGYQKELIRILEDLIRSPGREKIEFSKDWFTIDGRIIPQYAEKIEKVIVDAAARRFAEHVTFQDIPGNFTSAIMRARNAIPILGRLLVPFIQTRMNMLKRGIELYPGIGIPFGIMSKLSPPEIIAKQIEGAIISALFFSIFASPDDENNVEGTITGAMPLDPAHRDAFLRSGKMPYSVLVDIPGQGKTWIDYRVFEPFGLPLSMIADFYENAQEYIKNNADPSKDKQHIADLMSTMFHDIAVSLVEASFLRVPFEIISSQNMFERGTARTLSSVVPYSGFWRMLERAYYGGTEGKIPLYSGTNVMEIFAQNLPFNTGEELLGIERRIRFSVFGEQHFRESKLFERWFPAAGALRAVLPIEWQRSRLDSVEEALQVAGVYPGIPGQSLTVGRGRNAHLRRLDDDIYREYVVSYGLKARKRLESLVSRPSFKLLSKERQAELITRNVALVREREQKRVRRLQEKRLRDRGEL